MHKGCVDLGPFATSWWDWAQRTSHTELPPIFASLRKLVFLSITTFRYKFYELLATELEANNDYSEVILQNTQPNCLQALVFSTARYNREIKAFNQKNIGGKQKNTVKFINHFTDMPTLHAKMFIEEMASINVVDLDDAQFELCTRMPIAKSKKSYLSTEALELLHHQKLKELFPKLYHNLSPSKQRVKIVDGPIREEFVKRRNTPAKRSDGLNIKFSNKAKFDVINDTIKNTFDTFHSAPYSAIMNLDEDVEIVSIMLGSQASIEGTIGLVEKKVKLYDKCKKNKKVLFWCKKIRRRTYSISKGFGNCPRSKKQS